MHVSTRIHTNILAHTDTCTHMHTHIHTHAHILKGGGDNWVSKCQDVLKRVLKDLGADVGIFYHPVKTTVLPDYYK